MKNTAKWLAGLAAVTMLVSVAAPALAHHTDWYTKRGLIPPGQMYRENPRLYYRESRPNFFRHPVGWNQYNWNHRRENRR